jgi:hypothetical protein
MRRPFVRNQPDNGSPSAAGRRGVWLALARPNRQKRRLKHSGAFMIEAVRHINAELTGMALNAPI